MTESTGLSRDQLQDRAIKGALWTLVHVVVSLPLAFAVNIVLARTLGVVDYGRLAYLTTVMLLVSTVVDLGVVSGVVQFGSKAHASGRFADAARLLSASKGFRIAVGMPVIALAVLLVVDVDPVMMAVALVFGVVMPCVLGGAGEALGIENKTAQGAQAAMIVNLGTQVLVVVAATTLGTADSIWVVRVVAGGFGALVFLAYVSRTYRRAVMRPRLRGFPSGFWRFAIPAGSASMVAAFVLSRSEVLVLTWMSETHAAGVFALAIGLASHLFAPALSLVGPLVPAISGLHEVDGDAVGRALGRTLRAASTVMAAIVAAALPAFAFLVPLLYGEEFSDVPQVLLALGLAGGLLVIAEPLKAFIAARLKGMWLLWLNLTALVVSVSLMLLLIPPLGVWGAVLSNVGSATVLVTLLITLEVRSAGTRVRRTLGDVAPYVLGMLTCGVVWWGTGMLGLSVVPSAAVAAAGGLVLVTGAMWLTRRGLTPQDAEAVQRSLPVRLRRVLRLPLRLVTSARDREGPAHGRVPHRADDHPAVGAP